MKANNSQSPTSWFAMLVVVSVLTGCTGQAKQEVSSPASASDPGIDGAAYLLAAEPEGAREVMDARATASDEEQIVVVGRIGGSTNPWVEGRAAFSIVDSSLKACSDREGDDCPVPWDYCCETDKLPTATALVKVVDAEGNLVKHDARHLLSLAELQTVVVRGLARRDDAGNLTIHARGVFLRP